MAKPHKNPRKFCKKYSPHHMEAAISAVKGGQSVYRSAKQFGIPYNSLKDQLKRLNDGIPLTLGSPTHLYPAEENEIVDWVNTCQLLGYPRTWAHIKLAARTICRNNHGPCCRPANQLPSFQWLQGFKSRHPSLKPRKSEAVSKAGANVTKENIIRWFQTVRTWLVMNTF